MANLILTTFDWVPEMPRGFVRGIRVRWALDHAGLPRRISYIGRHNWSRSQHPTTARHR